MTLAVAATFGAARWRPPGGGADRSLRRAPRSACTPRRFSRSSSCRGSARRPCGTRPRRRRRRRPSARARGRRRPAAASTQQVADRAVGLLAPLALDALAVVVELGGLAEQPVVVRRARPAASARRRPGWRHRLAVVSVWRIGRSPAVLRCQCVVSHGSLMIRSIRNLRGAAAARVAAGRRDTVVRRAVDHRDGARVVHAQSGR